METKNVPSQEYFCFTATTTLKDLNSLTMTEVDNLFQEAGKAGLQPAGPLEFIYFDSSADVEKPFTLEIALPVAATTALANSPYAFKKHEPFKCLSHIHKGSLVSLGEVYNELFGKIYPAGYKPTNQVREVYHTFVEMASPENITEIQIGIN